MNIASLDLSSYSNIFILTGAGVSVASGLPTYRGPGGLWEKEEIAQLVDARNLPGSLPGLWNLYRDRRRVALDVAPNPAHTAIAALQQKAASAGSPQVTLVTQNVDGLHQKAGSKDVLEMHGSAFRTRCLNPRCALTPFQDISTPNTPPVCPVCGSFLRPDVVLFGENISGSVLNQLEATLPFCDLFIAVGTSGSVWPAAQFVQAAKTIGARTVNVNFEPSDNPYFDDEHLGRAEEIMPVLLGVADELPRS